MEGHLNSIPLAKKHSKYNTLFERKRYLLSKAISKLYFSLMEFECDKQYKISITK